jgi:predicted MFS family arabinose efflux permease
LPTRPLVTLTRAISGLSVGGVFLLPVAALAAAGLFAIHAFVTAIVGVGMTLLLSREAPGGKATAQSLLAVSGSLGTALGAALGGLLLTVSDYQVVGLVAALFGLVSAALIWWSRPRAAEMPVAGVGQ